MKRWWWRWPVELVLVAIVLFPIPSLLFTALSGPHSWSVEMDMCAQTEPPGTFPDEAHGLDDPRTTWFPIGVECDWTMADGSTVTTANGDWGETRSYLVIFSVMFVSLAGIIALHQASARPAVTRTPRTQRQPADR